MEAETENLPSKLLWLVAPTRKIFEVLRRKYRLSIVSWSLIVFSVNLAFLFGMPRFQLKERFSVLHILAVWLIPFSRVIEIAYAFYNDALDQLAHKKLGSGISKVNRIRLLGLSYIELSICYASLFFFLPDGNIDGAFGRFQSLYFSWVTITTTGYGDMKPVSDVARILCMSEIGLGLMLIVVAVGTYLSYQETSPNKSGTRKR